MVQLYTLTQICHIRNKKGKTVQNKLCLLSKYLTEDVSELQFIIPQVQGVPTATDPTSSLFQEWIPMFLAFATEEDALE